MGRKYFRVWSEIDRGEGTKPRFISGYCHPFGMTKDEAEQIAAQEKAKSYVTKVRIDACDTWGKME